MYNEIFLRKMQKSIERKEHFNERLINYRKNEDIQTLMDDICKSLEIIEGIKYLGSSIEKNNKIYKNKPPKDKDNDANAKKKINRKENIERNRFIKITLNFELTYKDEVSTKTVKMYYPELIDGQYYLLNDNKYCPVLQLVDSECYSTSNSVTLKTSLMPIVLRNEKYTLVDINERISYLTKNINLDLFKNKINIFHYYFARFGIEKTFEFFKFQNGDDAIISIDEEPYDNDPESDEYDCYSFRISKNIYLNVWKEWLDRDLQQNSIMVATLINAFKGRTTMDKLYDIEYWKRKLGSHFTKNNSNLLEKSISILNSLERLLDNTTRRNLRIKNVDKKNIYTIMRWMMINYKNLFNIDNNDLANKRIRITEYLLYEFTNKLSKNVYRMINSKNMSMKKLKSVLSNFHSDFLVKMITNNDLVRYSNQVNTLDLFMNLKGTVNGPQTMLVKSANLQNKSLHPSYLERIDLCATSSNDPGSSFTLTPFCIIYDNFFFTKKPSVKTISIEDIKVE